MTRVDVPTLQCDRCGIKTQDLTEMSRFNTLSYDHMNGQKKWDFCPECWKRWIEFLSAGANEVRTDG